MELNDDCLINVSLSNEQWTVLTEVVSHILCEQTKNTVKELEQQFQAWSENKENQSKQFVGKLPIKTYNMLIFALFLAPYYRVVGIISEIQSQGEKEIARLREQYAATSKQQLTEHVETSTKKRTARKRSKTKAE